MFFLVGGSTLVRHTELRVEAGRLYDGATLVAPLSSPPSASRLGATIAAVLETRQPSSLRFNATGEARFADRFLSAAPGAAAGPGTLPVHVVLRASSVVDEPDMRGTAGTNPPNRRLLARLPPDLAYAISRRPVASAEDLARAVFASIPALLPEPRRTAFLAAATLEEPRVGAVCGWYQVGHATEAASVLECAISRSDST